VGAQFGEESGIHLVHRRVIAPQIPAEESGSSARDLGEVRRSSALIDHLAHPIPPILKRSHPRVAAGDLKRDGAD
jgi:hypothetical protein